MAGINLQNKTKAKEGKIEIYYFENENIGLKKTLFHRIYVPLEPFNSGLEYESQPLETEIVIEWLNLNLIDPTNLDGVNLISNHNDDLEISIYVGNAHNPCDLIKMSLRKVEGITYEIKCNLFVDFQHEGVAINEDFNFKTKLKLDPIIKE